MAAACTYADLRFVKAPPKAAGSRPAGSSSASVEDGELMYENFKGTRGAAEITNRGGERRPAPQVCTVQPFWKKHNVHILVVMCLILLASCIGIGFQFFQMYQKHQRQTSDLTKTMEIMNWTMQKQQRSYQEAHLASNLTATQMINNCTSSLHSSWEQQEQSKLELENVKEKGKQMENKLNAARQLLDDYEDTECCEKGWILLAGICLYFSQEKMKIYEGLQHCKSKDASLIGTRIQDPVVKAFMKDQWMRDEYWVGMRTNSWNPNRNWMDIKSPDIDLKDYTICGITKGGAIKPESCNTWHSQYKYICEQHPLRFKLKRGIPVWLHLDCKKHQKDSFDEFSPP